MAQKICFLTYLPRSGSTLLAKELDKYRQICVTIEDNIPDGILQGSELYIENIKELDDYLDILYKDLKFKKWHIERDSLRNLLIQKGEFPILINTLFNAIYDLYFRNNPEVVIHKKGKYWKKVEKVRELFPKSKLIYIDRDPRAIYNSQKNSRDSITGRIMSDNIVSFALGYKYNRSIINKHCNEKDFHIIYYENFLKNKENEIREILNFLSLEDHFKEDVSTYQQKIPESQNYLHVNLDKEFIEERASAWQKELQNEEIYFLQHALRNDLKKKKYPFLEVNFRDIKRKVKTIRWLSVFHIKHLSKLAFPYLYRLLKRLFRK
ncbi:MAG: sulfotransferase [bacterium]